jgi:hypothetical protein
VEFCAFVLLSLLGARLLHDHGFSLLSVQRSERYPTRKCILDDSNKLISTTLVPTELGPVFLISCDSSLFSFPLPCRVSYIIYRRIIFSPTSTLPVHSSCSHHHARSKHSNIPPPLETFATQCSPHLLRRLPAKLRIHTTILKHRESKRRPVPNMGRNPAILPPSSITPSINLPLRLPRPIIPTQNRLARDSVPRTARHARPISHSLRFKQQPIPRPLRLRGAGVRSPLATVVFGVGGGICFEAEFAYDDQVLNRRVLDKMGDFADVC